MSDGVSKVTIATDAEMWLCDHSAALPQLLVDAKIGVGAIDAWVDRAPHEAINNDGLFSFDNDHKTARAEGVSIVEVRLAVGGVQVGGIDNHKLTVVQRPSCELAAGSVYQGVFLGRVVGPGEDELAHPVGADDGSIKLVAECSREQALSRTR